MVAQQWAFVEKRWGSVTDATHGAVGDRNGMQPTDTPVELSSDTVDALAVVHAWGRAFNDLDLDRLLALSTPDIRLGDNDRVADGHEGLRRIVHLQSYGVAQHAHPHRYIARGSTVAVEAALELRWVDGGELADTCEGVAIFEVTDGRVRSFRPQPDLTTASRVTDRPPANVPTATAQPARRQARRVSRDAESSPRKSNRPRSTT
jgi:hypothetical protein